MPVSAVPWRVSNMNQGSRFQVVIVDVAESHHLLVLDVAVFGVATPHSSGVDDGDPRVLTSTKGRGSALRVHGSASEVQQGGGWSRYQ